MDVTHEFALPDVGEGLTEAEVTRWLVAVGDGVEINDLLVEIETAKALVELPSPVAGVVGQILVPAGQTVAVGTPLISIATTAGAPVDAHAEDERPQVLVGPGPSHAAPRRRRLAARARAVPPPLPEGAPTARARATPPVRGLAKKLGVDIEVLAAATRGPVTREDVVAAGANGVPSIEARPPGIGVPDRRETRIPVRGVRKATAAAMVRSAFTAPHVTEWLTVDVTRTMDLVRKTKADPAWQDVRVSPLVIVARALLLAVREFPGINACWDDLTDEIVHKHYVNLGIAAATPRGLLVPNVKDAQDLGVRALAEAIAGLVDAARSGRTPPADLTGGTITITNIGALGVDAGTPILNPGEAAILAFGAIRERPWIVDGQLCARHVTQLAMSFDHRLVDGELGSNVLVRVGEVLADPGTTLLHA